MVANEVCGGGRQSLVVTSYDDKERQANHGYSSGRG